MPESSQVWIEVLQWALSILGIVAASVGGWLLKRYNTDRTMLTRHDELLAEHEKELGLLKAMRNATDNGEKPIRMIAELQNTVQQLDDEMIDWKECNRIRDQSFNDMNEKVTAILQNMATATNDIAWIKKTMEAKQ